MAKASPTQRALAECKKRGWRSAIVERWNSFAKLRQDLFGFADLVALDGKSILALQVTSGDHVTARMAKMSGLTAVVDWLKCGGKAEVWGFRKLQVEAKKRKKGTKPATRWALRRVSASVASDGIGLVWTEVDELAPPLVDLPGSPT